MDTLSGFNQKPITLHKYLYANSDPVNNIDPSGNVSLGSVLSSIRVIGQLAKTSVSNIGKSVLKSLNKNISNIGKTNRNGLKPKKKLDKNARKKDEEADNFKQFMTMLEARMGAGKVEITSDRLADTPRLNAAWGEGVWVKMSHTRKLSGGSVVRVHYFRNLTTMQNVEFKFKRRK